MTSKKVADWVVAKEAEALGLMVSMTSITYHNRTKLNDELYNYFIEKAPDYKSSFDEDEGEDIISNINEYLAESNIDKYPLYFPFDGTDVHLIPINDNIKLRVKIVDEYYGDGDYNKYVMINAFIINENTTKQDVDELIEFVNKYLVLETIEYVPELVDSVIEKWNELRDFIIKGIVFASGAESEVMKASYESVLKKMDELDKQYYESEKENDLV